MHELNEQELEQVVGGNIPTIPVLNPPPGLRTGNPKNRYPDVFPKQGTGHTCVMPISPDGFPTELEWMAC